MAPPRGGRRPVRGTVARPATAGQRSAPASAGRWTPRRRRSRMGAGEKGKGRDGRPRDLARRDRRPRHGALAALLARRARALGEARHRRGAARDLRRAAAQAARGLPRLERGPARVLRRARPAALGRADGRARAALPDRRPPLLVLGRRHRTERRARARRRLRGALRARRRRHGRLRRGARREGAQHLPARPRRQLRAARSARVASADPISQEAPMTARDRLAAAADRLELAELLHRYAWAIDSGDWALLAQVFTEDAEADFSSVGQYVEGESTTRGRDAIVAWLRAALAPFPDVLHFMSNQLVEIDGDRARTLTYMHVLHMSMGGIY